MPYDVSLPVERVNLAALTERLRATLGDDAITGATTARGMVRVHFVKPPTLDEQRLVQGIVAEHDPDELTGEQRAALERQQAEADARPKALAALGDLTANWGKLTETQKADCMRQALVWLMLREMARD